MSNITEEYYAMEKAFTIVLRNNVANTMVKFNLRSLIH